MDEVSFPNSGIISKSELNLSNASKVNTGTVLNSNEVSEQDKDDLKPYKSGSKPNDRHPSNQEDELNAP